MLIASVLLAAIEMPHSAKSATSTLELAEKGLRQCWRPDLNNKTCRVIVAYRKTGPESYDTTAILALSIEGPVTIETRSPVVVRDNAVCGAIRTEELKTSVVRNGAQIVDPAHSELILNQMAQVMAPIDGVETCTHYEPSGSDFIAKISVAGTYRPLMDQRVKWISPEDGYTVVP